MEEKDEIVEIVDDSFTISEEVLNMTHGERVAEIKRLKKVLLGKEIKDELDEK